MHYIKGMTVGIWQNLSFHVAEKYMSMVATLHGFTKGKHFTYAVIKSIETAISI